jgi:hypothetical protein
MIARGAENLIAASAEGASVTRVKFSETNERVVLPEGTTHIIVSGSPWLWDRAWRSPKWRSMTQICKDNPQAKVLFLGVGSCYPLGKEQEISDSIVKLGATKVKEFFDGATIVVRDHLILETLTQCGVKAELLVCPAYFAKENLPYSEAKKPHNSLFFYDPKNGISAGCFTDEERNALVKKQFDWAKEKNAMVYVVNQHEMNIASSAGFFVKMLHDTDQAFAALHASSEVLSGRVHLAIPALSLGIPTELIPVDSRAQTVEYARIADVEKDRKRLIEILKEFLNAQSLPFFQPPRGK